MWSPETNKWVLREPYPEESITEYSAVYHNKFYIFGGSKGAGNVDIMLTETSHDIEVYKKIRSYDYSRDLWNEARFSFRVFVQVFNQRSLNSSSQRIKK